MNQISLKTIFKEPIFTAVEGKSPVVTQQLSRCMFIYRSTPYSASRAAAAMLKVKQNYCFLVGSFLCLHYN